MMSTRGKWHRLAFAALALVGCISEATDGEATAAGAGSEPSGMLGAASEDTGVTTPPTRQVSGPTEWSDGTQLYTGEISAVCDKPPLPGVWGVRTEFQWLANRDGDQVDGTAWSRFSGTGEITGTLSDGTLTLAAFGPTFTRNGQVMVDRMLLKPSGDAWSGTGSMRLQTIVGGDMLVRCDGMATLTLSADDAPPNVDAIASNVAGVTPLILSFDEPVESNAVIEVSQADRQVPVTVEVQSGPGELANALSVTPQHAWPEGELKLTLHDVVDAGGNRAAPIHATLTGRRWVSATTDPSFEATDKTDGPWVGCKRTETFVYMSSLDGKSVTLLPSDGDYLALCSGNGPVLQAYIEPPTAAKTMHLDLATINGFLGTPIEAATVELVYADGRELMMSDSAPSPPAAYHTFTRPLQPNRGGFWLVVDVDGPIHGSGQGNVATTRAVVDNLRFQ